ncbi:TetR/AcrR family transcriptional regulator [Amycolatopsis magusensis]|uniref:TetR/AcrR family transcriptional regulator n=1 Tax=Amycolatopsis magusensis TaxID=882444 RepID=UPI0024A9F363|nr:TetR/AcrR family transcriptional regulator [Amycolatopsis magusensis]MDI5978618.1 TetR/AcrR family transcriptional regulator [Amycolatopsis magusensis]
MPDRIEQIVEAARALIEEGGSQALTMRAIADRLGIRAPSLYKHFPDKLAVEAGVIAIAMNELAAELAKAESLTELAAAYRAYALEHPHLYRLMNSGPLPRHLLPAGVEDRAALPLVRVAGNEDLARAIWAFAHGMVILELDGRFPPGADLGSAWRTGLSAFGFADTAAETRPGGSRTR